MRCEGDLTILVAAVITPTADIFTLLLVTVPLYCLYEVSIWVVARTRRGDAYIRKRME